MKSFVSAAVLTALGCFSVASFAAATDDLSRFLKNVTSAQGSFEQKVFTREGENKDAAGTGDFAFLRPGKCAPALASRGKRSIMRRKGFDPGEASSSFN